jgi:hypothetical protein
MYDKDGYGSMTSTILGNYIGNLLCRHGSLYDAQTRLVIDIQCFPQKMRHEVARDVIHNLAQGGGAADWDITQAGILIAWLHKATDNTAVAFSEDNTVFVQCVLERQKQPPCDATLSITARVPWLADESHRTIGTTQDGLWLSQDWCSNRERYDRFIPEGIHGCDWSQLSIVAHEHTWYAHSKIFTPDCFLRPQNPDNRSSPARRWL